MEMLQEKNVESVEDSGGSAFGFRGGEIHHHSWNILSRSAVVFCPCSGNLSQVEFNGNDLICLGGRKF